MLVNAAVVIWVSIVEATLMRTNGVPEVAALVSIFYEGSIADRDIWREQVRSEGALTSILRNQQVFEAIYLCHLGVSVLYL